MGILDGLKNAWRKYHEGRTVKNERRTRESKNLKLKGKETYFRNMGRQQAISDLRERDEKIASRDILGLDNKWGFVKGVWKRIKKR